MNSPKKITSGIGHENDHGECLKIPHQNSESEKKHLILTLVFSEAIAFNALPPPFQTWNR